MADYYVNTTYTTNGDGTAATEAGSPGGVGAWLSMSDARTAITSLAEDTTLFLAGSVATKDIMGSAPCNWTALTMNGFTFTLQGSNASGVWGADYYTLGPEAGFTDVGLALSSSQYARDIQVDIDRTGSICTGVSIDSATANCEVDGCVIQGVACADSSVGIAAGNVSAASSVRIFNNVVNGMPGGAVGCYGILARGSVRAYNNSVYNIDGYGMQTRDATVLKNNFIHSCVVDIRDRTSSGALTNNVAEDDLNTLFSTTGNTQTSQTITQLVTSTSDFRPISGSDLLDAGVGPSSDAEVSTPDAGGNTRSGTTCDAGALEYQAAGGGSSIPVIHAYRRMMGMV